MTNGKITNANVKSDETRWTELSIRFSSTAMSAKSMERILGDEPSDTAELGERISPRSIQAGTHESSMCIFTCPIPADADPQLHCVWAATFLDEHRAALIEMGAACQVDVFMSFASTSGQGGLALPASVLSTLARAGANFYITLYPPEDTTNRAV